MKRVTVTRVGVTRGASLPKWQLTARNAAGVVQAVTGENNWGFDPQPRAFTVEAPSITRMDIAVDNRHGGGTFATYSCLPIAEIRLVPAPLTEPGRDENAAPGDTLSGLWESEWGPVTLNVSEGGVTGSWDQGSGKIGKIVSGSFDPRTRILTFRYYQDWNDQNGSTVLTVSADGMQLVGTWSQENGEGKWILTRRIDAKP